MQGDPPGHGVDYRDRKQIGDNAGPEWEWGEGADGEELHRDTREPLGALERFTIFTWVVVSVIYTYVRTHPIVYFAWCILCQ